MDHRIQPRLMPKMHPQRTVPKKAASSGTSFDGMLKQEIGRDEGLKVSKHAERRLSERNIFIDNGQWQAIENRVSEARQKGITDSLVVTKNAALIVSTKNNTVVTAMNRKEAGAHLFTNINGTILMDE
ncbi:MAG TPA: TIGR02530 family flagellar biosynthesis protein [Bacillales bacterium]|nr:TIGR02530 family flagellar biosynthesis protein [Bacillales bacterium]